jgi:hypothetical protein
MSLKDHLDSLVLKKKELDSNRVAKVKTKELEYWSESYSIYWKNHPYTTPTGKEAKIYNSIILKIDKETTVSAREFVYWCVENWQDFKLKHPYPKLSEFCFSYQRLLNDFIVKQSNRRENRGKSLRVTRNKR